MIKQDLSHDELSYAQVHHYQFPFVLRYPMRSLFPDHEQDHLDLLSVASSWVIPVIGISSALLMFTL